MCISYLGKIVAVAKTVAACISPKIPSSAVFVDVRRADEFAEGHCSTAKNVVWDAESCKIGVADTKCKAFIDGMKALVTTGGVADYSKPIFIHCVSGSRSGQAALFLQVCANVRVRVGARIHICMYVRIYCIYPICMDVVYTYAFSAHMIRHTR